jgi:hypothetical protein
MTFCFVIDYNARIKYISLKTAVSVEGAVEPAHLQQNRRCLFCDTLDPLTGHNHDNEAL